MSDSYEEPSRCRWCGEWLYPPVCPTCGTDNPPGGKVAS